MPLERTLTETYNRCIESQHVTGDTQTLEWSGITQLSDETFSPISPVVTLFLILAFRSITHLWTTQPYNPWAPAFFTGSKNGPDVKLTTHCHPVPMLWMSGAKTLLSIYVFKGMDREGHTFIFYHNIIGGMRWRSSLRHCFTSWEFSGSIPDVTRIFPASL